MSATPSLFLASSFVSAIMLDAAVMDEITIHTIQSKDKSKITAMRQILPPICLGNGKFIMCWLNTDHMYIFGRNWTKAFIDIPELDAIQNIHGIHTRCALFADCAIDPNSTQDRAYTLTFQKYTHLIIELAVFKIHYGNGNGIEQSNGKDVVMYKNGNGLPANSGVGVNIERVAQYDLKPLQIRGVCSIHHFGDQFHFFCQNNERIVMQNGKVLQTTFEPVDNPSDFHPITTNCQKTKSIFAFVSRFVYQWKWKDAAWKKLIDCPIDLGLSQCFGHFGKSVELTVGLTRLTMFQCTMHGDFVLIIGGIVHESQNTNIFIVDIIHQKSYTSAVELPFCSQSTQCVLVSNALQDDLVVFGYIRSRCNAREFGAFSYDLAKLVNDFICTEYLHVIDFVNGQHIHQKIHIDYVLMSRS